MENVKNRHGQTKIDTIDTIDTKILRAEPELAQKIEIFTKSTRAKQRIDTKSEKR